MNIFNHNSASAERLACVLESSYSIVVGAGAGLSAAAGYDYAGERFRRYFSDFAQRYHFRDMYAGGFYPYATPEEHWAYWSRYIWINRYAPIPGTVYEDLLELLGTKDYFVLTTNVDHCFQRTGFDKERLFYTQGDYGLFQCSKPCCQKTWDNYVNVKAMVEAQGFVVEPTGQLSLPEGTVPAMTVPSELVPHCPRCGRSASMNLRSDETFVEDAGWHKAARRYHEYLRAHAKKGQPVLFLELGVGANTPVIIKYPFWRMTKENPQATYACVNKGEAWAPQEIAARSLLLDEDIARAMSELKDSQEANG